MAAARSSVAPRHHPGYRRFADTRQPGSWADFAQRYGQRAYAWWLGAIEVRCAAGEYYDFEEFVDFHGPEKGLAEWQAAEERPEIDRAQIMAALVRVPGRDLQYAGIVEIAIDECGLAQLDVDMKLHDAVQQVFGPSSTAACWQSFTTGRIAGIPERNCCRYPLVCCGAGSWADSDTKLAVPLGTPITPAGATEQVRIPYELEHPLAAVSVLAVLERKPVVGAEQ
eukprot:TRINITY_DN51128_c0_g1_i1.p1 TRINITY_DN51128_c0_g1~~TRINITY_DN51128_c0_g1_i1.p1  ORF type:complete len:225 (+),score=59.44 TRINITY_DN51128_c0_g1_i1:93-767(+)